ncbi:MAG: DUF1294 domain-containing protein [Lachnospiraceae bacterium]|nr:DUF1294 domain-containing protein [Lachnospiraceae bacterium]
MPNINTIIAVYILILSLAGFLSMEADKRKAIKHARRIPERVLFLIAILGGSLGSLIGMYVFRHKTKHWYFVIGMPVILVVQVIILLLLEKNVL